MTQDNVRVHYSPPEVDGLFFQKVVFLPSSLKEELFDLQFALFGAQAVTAQPPPAPPAVGPNRAAIGSPGLSGCELGY